MKSALILIAAIVMTGCATVEHLEDDVAMLIVHKPFGSQIADEGILLVAGNWAYSWNSNGVQYCASKSLALDCQKQFRMMDNLRNDIISANKSLSSGGYSIWEGDYVVFVMSLSDYYEEQVTWYGVDENRRSATFACVRDTFNELRDMIDCSISENNLLPDFVPRLLANAKIVIDPNLIEQQHPVY